MPHGTKHEETGWLNERDDSWSLRRDGGGEWRLDLGYRAWLQARRLTGRRVRLVGVRDGFDLLAVERIAALDG
jgi:hypothetical protein